MYSALPWFFKQKRARNLVTTQHKKEVQMHVYNLNMLLHHLFLPFLLSASFSIEWCSYFQYFFEHLSSSRLHICLHMPFSVPLASISSFYKHVFSFTFSLIVTSLDHLLSSSAIIPSHLISHYSLNADTFFLLLQIIIPLSFLTIFFNFSIHSAPRHFPLTLSNFSLPHLSSSSF